MGLLFLLLICSVLDRVCIVIAFVFVIPDCWDILSSRIWVSFNV